MAFDHAIDQILQRANAARSDHRHFDCIGNGARQFQIKAGLGAVPIHRGHQQFAGAALDHAGGKFDGIEPGRLAPAMGEDFPLRAIVATDATIQPLLGVNRDDDALIAELVGGAGDEIGIADRRRIDRYLVGPGQQELANVFDGPHATADSHRHEAMFGRARHHVKDRLAPFVAGGNIEEGQFVGARRIIGDGGFDGIAGVLEIDELHALDDAAAHDVEAGDQTGLEGHFSASLA